MTADAFRDFAHAALKEFSSRKVSEEAWHAFASNLDYVPLTAGPSALKAAVEKAETSSGAGEIRRLQFAIHETGLAGDVLEAYERLILDAMRGDHTLFTTATGIERVWKVSTPLLEGPPPVRPYAPGSWGPNAIHQLIAPP